MKPSKIANLLWFGPASDPSGYGVASRGYLRQMASYDDLNVRLINRRFWGHEPYVPADFDLFLSMTHAPCIRSLPIIAVFHLTPDHYAILDGVNKHIGLTTFETDAVPLSWRVYMRGMDEMWTFTGFNERTFSRAGLGRPVHVIPHGVDAGFFHQDKSLALDELKQVTEGRYVFGSLFSWDKRKNPHALIRSYLDAFAGPLSSKVALVLKVITGDNAEKRLVRTRNEIQAIKQDVTSRTGKTMLPPITLMVDIMDDEKLLGFYNSLDCYVLPSSGEGWSLTHSEAMACGLPVIATGWSGNTEYMNTNNSYLLSYHMARVSPDMCSEITQIGHRWAIPDYDDLKRTMFHVFQNPDEAKHVGERAARNMAEFWSWERAGEKLHENIVRVASEESKVCRCYMTVNERPKPLKLTFTFDSDCDRDRTKELRKTLEQRGHEVRAGKTVDPGDSDVWFCGIYGDEATPSEKAAQHDASFKGQRVVFQCNDEAELMVGRLPGGFLDKTTAIAHNYLYHDRSVYNQKLRDRLVLLPGFLPDHEQMHYGTVEHDKMKRLFFMGQATGKTGQTNQRIELVRLLINSGLPFFGGITGDQHTRDSSWGSIKDLQVDELSQDKYLEEMRNSFVCLCPAGNSPMTYRMYEAWSVSSLAMVPESVTTLDILGRPENGSEYVTFKDDLSDLVDKCCYYMTTPDDVIGLAINGYHAWERLYRIEDGRLTTEMEELVAHQFHDKGIIL